MKHLLRLIAVGGFVAFAVLAPAMGMARSYTNLLAPARMLLLLIMIAFYFLPTALAVYRNCKAVFWIVLVNVFLGWTVFGWVISLGWAAGGKPRKVTSTLVAPPTHPVPSH